MVPTDYTNYRTIYASQLTSHIMRYIYPIKHEYYLLGTYIRPIYKLINLKSKTREMIVNIEYLEHGIETHIMRDILMDISKDKLYELTNYIISNYKPDYIYSDGFYTAINKITPEVNKLMENTYNYQDDEFKVDMDDLIHNFLQIDKCKCDSIYMFDAKFYDLRTSIILHSSCVINYYNLKNIKYNYHIEEYAHCIHPYNGIISDCIDYDNDDYLISNSAEIVSILDNADERSIHNNTLELINKEIIYIGDGQNKESYNYYSNQSDDDIMYDLIACYVIKHLLINYIGIKYLSSVIATLIEQNLISVKLFKRELIWIKHYFNYGSNLYHYEFIVIDGSFL